ncbi:MAG: polysaccharide biosynthesis protein [Gemmatimonadota bacterium]|nr:polysaccharide biosynthesis protein [Gemmatimonadota bacterium]
MITLLFRYRTLVLVALHFLLIVASYTLAFLLRFEWVIPQTYAETYWRTLPVVLFVRLLAFAQFRLYQGWWRYVGMRDLHDLLKAVGVSSLFFIALLAFFGLAADVPRTIYILDPMLTIGLIGGARFFLRAVRERRRPANSPRLRRVLIIGAGDAGELLLREMHNNPKLGYLPVGFVDDDARKTGFRIHGVEVLGTSAQLLEVLAAHPADELIIAIPSGTREQIQAIVNRCLESTLPFKIIPAIAMLRDGQVHMSQVRPVRIEDLLGREPVHFDATEIRADLAGRRVLITGAGGSIGAELARQIASYGPAVIGLLERSENALYLIEQELARKYSELDVRALICDVRDRRDLEGIFRNLRPDVVYHAAAFKHVPMMESHVAHAVHNNVFGTLNVAEMAADHGAKFVLISTDKAVQPSNVMGATKRLAEKLVLALNARGRNHFVAVRFGNVLGSNGSVVPLFREQIADGGPVTVTHPEATRYFMTIPEAVQLVLQAAALPEARDKIVMLEMGEPMKISELARNLIRLSGLEPDVDIPIVFTGLRPGEKLHEQLTSDCEETIPTRYEKIRIVKTGAPPSIERGLTLLWESLDGRDERTILRRLQEVVPEFSPQAALLASLRDRLGGSEAKARSRPAV